MNHIHHSRVNTVAIVGIIALIAGTVLLNGCDAETYKEITDETAHRVQTLKQSPQTDKYIPFDYHIACINGNEYIVSAHRLNLSPHLDDDGRTAVKCTVETDSYQ